MTAAASPAPFPIAALAVNVLGTLFVAGGLLGLFAPAVVDAVPAFKDPATAWTLLGVGIALDVGATVALVTRLRSHRQRK